MNNTFIIKLRETECPFTFISNKRQFCSLHRLQSQGLCTSRENVEEMGISLAVLGSCFECHLKWLGLIQILATILCQRDFCQKTMWTVDWIRWMGYGIWSPTEATKRPRREVWFLGGDGGTSWQAVQHSSFLEKSKQNTTTATNITWSWARNCSKEQGGRQMKQFRS